MYRQFRKIFLAQFFLSFSLTCWSQQIYRLEVNGLDERYAIRKEKADSLEALRLARKKLQELQQAGYWMASLDKFRVEGESVRIDYFMGRRYMDVNVTVLGALGEIKVPNKKNRGADASRRLNRLIGSTLAAYENNGYPFASIRFDSVSFSGSGLKMKMTVDKGPLITIDSISLNPDNLLRPTFLQNYLRLKYGTAYDETQVQAIPNRLQRLPFLQLESFAASYQLKKAKIQLSVQPRKVNYFDGILGFVPNRDGEGVEFTGELNLKLNNLFRSAKVLEFHWNKMEPKSQLLDVKYFHPVLLGTPLDFSFVYNQVRQDTLYSNRIINLKFGYRPTPNFNTSFFYENREGNELDDASDLSGDFSINFYGLGVQYSRLDHFFNPRRGWQFESEGSVGDKSISGLANTTQFRFSSKFATYLSTGKKSLLYFGLQGGVVLEDNLFLNDLYRIGGLRTVRGFNEGAIFASRYAVVNNEWRLYFEADSYLLAFVDLAFTQFQAKTDRRNENMQGLGAGMNLSVNNGQFVLIYALGQRVGQEFSFDSSKIHLGYVAKF